MEDRKEKIAPWLSVPQFGDWDLKGGQVPDYSLDFSKIREMRKQNKRDVSRASLGNEEELISSAATKPSTDHTVHHNYSQDHSPTVADRTVGASIFSVIIPVLSISRMQHHNLQYQELHVVPRTESSDFMRNI